MSTDGTVLVRVSALADSDAEELAGIADWVARNNRTVGIAYGDHTLRLIRATPEQQDKLINAWLASLPPGT